MNTYRLIMALCLALAVFSMTPEANAAVYYVYNTDPSGAGSLDQAIQDSNDNSGFPMDEIHFSIPVATDLGCDAVSGVCTIQLAAALTDITDPLLIDGFMQAGAQPHQGTGSVSQGLSTTLKIELDGSGASAGTNGLTFTAYGAVQGLAIHSFPANGIEASAGLVLNGNFIGTDVSGSVALPNGGHGVLATGAGNVSENVLSGNVGDGLRFAGMGMIVQNNLIGVQADGVSPLGNGGRGVTAHGPGLVGVFSTSFFPSNVIASNGQAGVAIGGASYGVVGVWRNSIYDNGALGIDVEGGVEDPFGVTAQAPSGNNAPILTLVSTNGVNTVVEGSVHGWPGMVVNLQFFYGDTCDPSGHGEGKNFLAATAVSLNSSGDANFSVTSTTPVPVGQTVSATASPLGPEYGATTEFSNCQIVYNWVVDTTGDLGDANPGDGLCSDVSGDCSLRAAIEESNANPALPNKTIAFNIPSQTDSGCVPATGVCTISSGAAFAVTEPVTIDGYTQPGATENTNPIDQPINAALKVEVAFSNTAFQITSGNTTVRGLVMNVNGFPFWIEANGGNVIEGNFLGTDVDGLLDPNGTGGGAGVRITSNNNVIGGTSPASRNLISGLLNGVLLLGGADGNVIQGNFIGTDRTGMVTIPNQTGIQVSGASNTQIGGALPASRNLVAGSTTAAIYLSSATDSQVEGNYVGTDRTGGPLWNNLGILVGTGATGNRLQRNVVQATNGLGIDLLPLGVTTNDPGDGDAGANERQNYPVVSAAGSDGVSSTTLLGSLSSTASTTFTVEFFSTSLCDPTGHGEGERYLGATVVSTGTSGPAGFAASLPVAVPAGDWVTATATDPNGNTSEFSACAPVFLDSDNDGIADAVDTAPMTSSDDFSDVALGGTTDGGISLRGDREWLIQDEGPNPGSGVRITVGPGSLGGQIVGTGSTCVPSSLVDVLPSSEANFVFTCASTTVKVLAGYVTATVGNGGWATMEVGPGGGVTFQTGGAALMITNTGSTVLSGRVFGRPLVLRPRESIELAL